MVVKAKSVNDYMQRFKKEKKTQWVLNKQTSKPECLTRRHGMIKILVNTHL